MSEPLVTGGVLANKRYGRGEDVEPPTTFVTTTVPAIYDDTFVVAATHPNVAKGHPKDDGWFLSDFYAFNYLLKGLGSSQIWLTVADPRKLLKSDPICTAQYLHGNPYQDRRVVLSEDLLDKEEFTPVTVVRHHEIVNRFLQEVRQASEKAKRQQAPLLLFLLCHGQEDYTFVLDHTHRAGTSKGLTVTRIKEAIEPGCRVTLISTACYSGGWVVWDLNQPYHTPLNITMLAAANADSTSDSWGLSRSLGRACGSVFTSSLIQNLTSATSPLLDDKTSDTLDDEDSLQPEDPTPQQTSTYNRFCQSILDVCKTRVTRLWHFQTFTFSAQDDRWDYSWTRRTGIPLSHFERRWNALPVVPYTGSLEDKMTMDPDPSNPSFEGSTELSKTGGLEIVDEMTKSICQHRVANMAKLLLQTCPGEWSTGWGQFMYGTVSRALEEDTSYAKLCDISAAIRFWWEQALLADDMVQKFGLPVPGGKICILWDRRQWQLSVLPKCKDMHHIAFRMFAHAGFKPTPFDDQGPPFDRITFYMAAAVAEAKLPEDETRALVKDLIEFMDKVKDFHRQRVIADTTVIQDGENWLKSIGRKIRQTLHTTLERQRPVSESEGEDDLAMRFASIAPISGIRPSTPGPIELGSSKKDTGSTKTEGK